MAHHRQFHYTGPQEPAPTKHRKPPARPGESGAKLKCHLNRHEPFARQANWTGEHYVSKCEHCSAPIRRVSSGKWVKDRSALDYL